MDAPKRLPLHNVIFDLDGTLVDSSGDIVACICRAYATVGLDVAAGGIIDKVVVGPPVADMLRALTPELPPPRLQAVLAAFREAYDNSPLERTLPYPGVREMLHHLRSAGAIILLATNKPALPTARILQRTALGDCFRDVVTPESFAGGTGSKTAMVRRLIERWKLEKDKTVVVGDSPADIGAARENGVRSAAVLSGYGAANELRRCGATVVLKSIGEVFRCEEFDFR